MQSRSRVRAIVLAAALSAAPTVAQCTTNWLPGNDLPGVLIVRALAARANGGLVAAAWSQAGQILTSQVLQWDGTTWTPLGPTFDNQIQAIVELPNGDLVAGGWFTMVGTTIAFGLARWNGTAWSSFGGTDGYVEALALAPNGDLIVAGNFGVVGGVTVDRVARWNGTTWSPVGSQGLPPGVNAVTVLPNGDIMAAGYFWVGSMQQCVALWNGTFWVNVGSFNGTVYTLHTMRNGNVAAGLYWSMGFAVWDGTTWTYPNGGSQDSVFALASLPNGDLVTGSRGGFGSGSYVNHIVRWRTTGAPMTWSSIGSVNSEVWALAMMPNGQLAAGGYFTTVNGQPHHRVAFLGTTCPAAATVGGAGCAGTAGLNVLTASNLPWTGSTFHARATGMTSNALALSLFGLSAVSLPQPLGLPGCSLLASPDAMQLLLPAGGSADTQLTIPDTAAFAGLPLHHQVLAIELNAQNAFGAATSTNSLVLTVGTF